MWSVLWSMSWLTAIPHIPANARSRSILRVIEATHQRQRLLDARARLQPPWRALSTNFSSMSGARQRLVRAAAHMRLALLDRRGRRASVARMWPVKLFG